MAVWVSINYFKLSLVHLKGTKCLLLKNNSINSFEISRNSIKKIVFLKLIRKFLPKIKLNGKDNLKLKYFAWRSSFPVEKNLFFYGLEFFFKTFPIAIFYRQRRRKSKETFTKSTKSWMNRRYIQFFLSQFDKCLVMINSPQVILYVKRLFILY